MPGANTFLTLAGYTFQQLEIPQIISLGGELIKNVHQLPGGVRVIDAMSASDNDIEWEGLFLGPNAIDNARSLDAARKAGQPVDLDWWNLSFQVLISKFNIVYERYYQVKYTVTCTVVQDFSLPPLGQSQTSVDDLVNSDSGNCFSSGEALGMIVPGALPGPVASSLGIGSLSMAITFPSVPFGLDLTVVAVGLTSIRTALALTPTFSGVSPADLGAMNQAIALTQGAAEAAIAKAETDMGAAPGFAGMVSGDANPKDFLSYMTVAGEEAQLIPMNDYLTRMQFNVSAGVI